MVNSQKEFEDQVKETYRSLKLFLRYLGVNQGEVADVAHEVYIKALKAYKDSYNDSRSFKNWLFAIAKNTLIDQKRNRNALKNTVSIDFSTTYVSSFTEVIQSQFAMKELVGILEEKDQMIVEFRFFQDLPFKEIASLMDMSEGAVKMRTGRILNKLREKIEQGKDS